MTKKVGEIIDYVDEMVSNRVNSTTKITFLNDIMVTAKEYNTETAILNTTGTVADTQTYDLPAYVKVEDIIWLGVAASTFGTTVISAASTTVYSEYKFKGIEDAEEGMRYFQHTTQFGLIPVPDDAYYMRIEYMPYLGPYTSTDTEITLNSHLINYIQDKLCSKVCKSAGFPRLDLANNYELDAMEHLNNAKRIYFQTLQQKSKRNISYKRWW